MAAIPGMGRPRCQHQVAHLCQMPLAEITRASVFLCVNKGYIQQCYMMRKSHPSKSAVRSLHTQNITNM